MRTQTQRRAQTVRKNDEDTDDENTDEEKPFPKEDRRL